MPATLVEMKRLRRRVAGDEKALPDEVIHDIFDDARETYAGYPETVIWAAVEHDALSTMWTAATAMVTYRQNDTTEQVSDMAKALATRVAAAKQKLDEAIADAVNDKTPQMWASMHKTPVRREDRPNG